MESQEEVFFVTNLNSDGFRPQLEAFRMGNLIQRTCLGRVLLSSHLWAINRACS